MFYFLATSFLIVVMATMGYKMKTTGTARAFYLSVGLIGCVAVSLQTNWASSGTVGQLLLDLHADVYAMAAFGVISLSLFSWRFAEELRNPKERNTFAGRVRIALWGILASGYLCANIYDDWQRVRGEMKLHSAIAEVTNVDAARAAVEKAIW